MSQTSAGPVLRASTPLPARPCHLREQVTLCDVLDRVLDTGAVVSGEIVISVAGVDLLYLGLNLVVGSVETLRGGGRDRGDEA
jgi:Gas vesicle protein